MGDELVQVARRVREQADQQPVLAQPIEHGQCVVVELEVRGVGPPALHLDGGLVRVADAAHAANDPLGEEHPDLLVVVELRVALHLRERRRAGFVVPRRVELEPVPAAELAVALGPQVGPGPGQGEIDVEDDGA